MIKYKYEKLKEYKDVIKLGEGGNGDVYKIVDVDGKENAIKFLRNKKNILRFKDEILVVSQNQSKECILPILDKVDILADQKEYWYIMPIAIPVSKIHLSAIDRFGRMLKAIQMFAIGLVDLHASEIYHRDIKPENLFIYNKKCVYADFGLTTYPGKKEQTTSSVRVGNYLTIAPEAKYVNKYHNEGIDWAKVDVYAFAKTAWMLLTGEVISFDGKYNEDDQKISLERYFADEYLVDLNKLIERSTDTDPNMRPTAIEFLEVINIFDERRKSRTTSNLIEWKHISNKIFGNNIPLTATYEGREKIVYILNQISKHGLSHAFFESGGGMDINGATLATERDCIEINFGYILIGKPKKVIYHNIDESNCAFNYIELEFDTLQHIFDFYDDCTEELYSLSNGKYTKFRYGEEGYNFELDEPLESGYRKTMRVLNGRLVIFPTRSIYNQLRGTYDGRHKNFNSSTFREYITNMKNDYYKLEIDEFYEKYNMFNP